MTKLLEQIKNEHAKQYNCDFEGIKHCLIEYDLDEIATRYATEVAKRSLEKAAKNATIKRCPLHYNEPIRILKTVYDERGNVEYNINKQSITDESNISL